jgi:hypothetical protein
VNNAEDQNLGGVHYLAGKEIYENAAGLGKAGNSIGVLLFNLVTDGGNTVKLRI